MPKNKKIFLILIMVLLTIFICSTTISATDNSVETSMDCVDEKIINEPVINENKVIEKNENSNVNYDDNSIKSNTNKTAITSEKSSNTESTQNIKKSTKKTNTVESSEIKSTKNINTVEQNAEDLNISLSSYEQGSNPTAEGLLTAQKELFTKTTTNTTQSSSVQTANSQAKRVYVSSLGLSIFDGSSILRPTSFKKATSNLKNNTEVYLKTERSSDIYIFLSATSLKATDGINIQFTGQSGKKIIFNGMHIGTFFNINSGYNITFKNIIFQNAHGKNGSINCQGSTLRFINCSFINNKATVNAAGVYAIKSNISFENCTFKTNTASSSGAVIFANESKVNIQKCNFIQNSAKNGAAIFSIESNLNITDSLFNQNSASVSGGAVSFLSIGKDMIINSTNFTNNKANNEGGAIYSTKSYVKVDKTNFTKNTASNGGAIYTGDNKYFQIYSSTLINNKANNGSAIYAVKKVSIVNSILTSSLDSQNIFFSKYENEYNLDQNWWGSNNPDFKVITNNLLPNNWIQLNVENKKLQNKSIQLTTTLINRNTTYTMPQNTLKFITKNGRFARYTTQINNSNINYYTGNINDCIITLNNEKINITHKIEPILYSNDIICNPGEVAQINIKTNNDTTQSTTIKFDNTTIYNSTIKNGKLNYTYFINPEYSDSKHIINITYNGDNKYQQKTILHNITIRPCSYNQTTYLNPTSIKEQIKTTPNVLPSKYNLRNYNQLTSVKDQKKSGNCWDFATIGTVESSILKDLSTNNLISNLINKYSYDFSENNLKNTLNKYSTLGDSSLNSNRGYQPYKAFNMLVSWYGCAKEVQDPYDEQSIVSPQLNATYHLQDYCTIPARKNSTDNDNIKKAIMTYGAVETHIRIMSSSINSYNAEYGTNHAVMIVGWDDNYDKNYFKTKNSKGETIIPPANGAFIIQNSWGDKTGDQGLQYVSYYDIGIGKYDMYAAMYDNKKSYDNIYQYETLVSKQRSSKLFSYKNNYISKQDEVLTAVGTHISKNVNYTIEVYVNNALKLTQKGQNNITGYRTIPLDQYIQLKKDDTFTVVLTQNSTTNVPVYLQSYNFNYDFKQNQSFIKYGNGAWQDLYSTSHCNGAPLKAYTKNIPLNINTNINIPTQTTMGEFKTNITTNTKGTLKIKINKNTIKTINNTKNNINFTYNLKEYMGENITITTEFTTSTYTITQQKNITIPDINIAQITNTTTKTHTKITINADNTGYKKTNTITGTLYDENNKALANQKITLTLNNQKIATLITNQNGKYTYTNTQNNKLGTNIIKATLTPTSQYITSENTTIYQVNENKVNIKYTQTQTKPGNTQLKIYITGDTINNTKLEIYINNTKLQTETIKTGTNTYKINMKTPGTHTLKLVYDGQIIKTDYTTITIDKYSTTLQLKATNITENQETKISGTLRDENQNIIKNAEIKITINNKVYYTKTDNNGNFELKYKAQTHGTYKVTATYTGSNNHKSSTTTTTFNVKKENIIVKTINKFVNKLKSLFRR